MADVGFIGLGDHGAPMAVAIAEMHALHVWARRAASYSPLEGVEHVEASTPQELAATVHVLCLCLPGDKETEDLLFEDGVAAALSRGSVVVNHATGDPTRAKKMGERLHGMGIRFLDAPVSGGRPGAEQRSLTCFVGGGAEVLEECRSIITCHSTSIVLMGAPGAGQMTKLTNNILTVSNMRNVVEAFRLAGEAGLDRRALQAALAHSSGGSFILQAIGRQISPRIAEHIAGLNRKDVTEFGEAMEAAGLDAGPIVDWAIQAPDGLKDLAHKLAE